MVCNFDFAERIPNFCDIEQLLKYPMSYFEKCNKA